MKPDTLIPNGSICVVVSRSNGHTYPIGTQVIVKRIHLTPENYSSYKGYSYICESEDYHGNGFAIRACDLEYAQDKIGPTD